MGFWSFLYKLVPDVWFRGMNLRSYTGIMLVNSIKLRRRDRKLRKALKRLKEKYNPDRVADLYKRYASTQKMSSWQEQRRIRKFQQKLDKLISDFTNDYLEFRLYFLDVLKLISQSLRADRRESYKEFNDVEALFAQIESKRSELVFPIKEVEAFKRHAAQLLRQIGKSIRTDELSDLRLERGGYPASTNIFSFKRWWSRAKLYRKERKETKKLGKNMELYEELYNRIMQELESGVRQDFLFLLIEAFKRVEMADKRLEEIKQDLMLVLHKLNEEIIHVQGCIAKILELFRNEPQVKNNAQFGKIKEDAEQFAKIIAQIPKNDFVNTEALRKKLGELFQGGNIVITEMEEQSRRLAA